MFIKPSLYGTPSGSADLPDTERFPDNVALTFYFTLIVTSVGRRYLPYISTDKESSDNHHAYFLSHVVAMRYDFKQGRYTVPYD